MAWWFFLIPVISAIAGWLLVSVALKMLFHPFNQKKILGYAWQGLIPKKQAGIARVVGKMGASLFPVNEIEEKITHRDNVKKIMPQAEEHIDHFLRVKLVKSMPVVGMFVGDKTINNLKALFIAELEQLFPEIMKGYIDKLQEDFDIERIITEKIAACSPASIETFFKQSMKKELAVIKLTGALFGFIISLLQVAVFLLLIR